MKSTIKKVPLIVMVVFCICFTLCLGFINKSEAIAEESSAAARGFKVKGLQYLGDLHNTE